MLYDKRWDKPEVKADPFSLESLIAWAEKQPADKHYDFWCNQCYLGQYFEAHGFEVVSIGTGTVLFRGSTGRMTLPPHFNAIAEATPHTFGAALARARAIRR